MEAISLARRPGFFVLLHIPLIGIVLLGLVLVAQRHKSSRGFSVALGTVGLGGGLLHSWFLFQGDTRFTSPVSLALIVAFIAVSVIQILVAIRLSNVSIIQARSASFEVAHIGPIIILLPGIHKVKSS